jgi:trehalose 6-phosphate phosphatase
MSERRHTTDATDDDHTADAATDEPAASAVNDELDTNTVDDEPATDTAADPPPDLRDRLADELRAHDHLVLCLDFDGTLAPIVSDPTDATIRSGNRESLRTLGSHDAVTVAVVSGRGLADVRERVGVDGLHYVGNAGLERAAPDEDDPRVHPDARRAEERLGRVRETLTDALGWTAGVAVEDKRWSLAVHTRHVDDRHHDRIADTVGRVADRAGGLHVSRGHSVLEVGPATDATKGAAVAALADESPADPLVVYVGDDHSDQTGLRVAASRGVAVFVGENGPEAAHHVGSPAVVGDLLAWLANDGPLGEGAD